jgi:secreted trypsin-like serine protease
MIWKNSKITHSLTAIVAAGLAVAATSYVIGWQEGKRHQPPTNEAIREAHERLATLLTIKPNAGQSPTASDQALAIVHSMEAARVIVNSDAVSNADKSVAQSIEQQRTRQLEALAATGESQRMINSHDAPDDGFQYQVAIIFNGSDPLYGLHCGGTLIDPIWVLTAAHCFTQNTQNDDFQIFTGSRKLSDTRGRLVPIAKIIRNKYDPATNERDIALVRLANPITDQAPMDLADTQTEATKITRMATVSGWGVTREGSNVASDKLQFAYIPLVDGNGCRTAYLKYSKNKVRDGMICAGEGKADACQGDSGGPLIIKTKGNKPYLDGIVSWGEGCNRTINGTVLPGVYTSVPAYITWIRSAMQSP